MTSSSYITDENPELLEMFTVSEVVGEKFVGKSSQDEHDDPEFDKLIRDTVALDEGYEEFFASTSKTFEEATPSELSKIAMDVLNNSTSLAFDDDVRIPNVNTAGRGGGVEIT